MQTYWKIALHFIFCKFSLPFINQLYPFPLGKSREGEGNFGEEKIYCDSARGEQMVEKWPSPHWAKGGFTVRCQPQSILIVWVCPRPCSPRRPGLCAGNVPSVPMWARARIPYRFRRCGEKEDSSPSNMFLMKLEELSLYVQSVYLTRPTEYGCCKIKKTICPLSLWFLSTSTLGG